MRPITTVLLACLSATSFLVTNPAVADVYECNFEKGHIAKPTPTRVVMEIDEYHSEGKLLEIEIPGVITRPGPIAFKRNDSKIASVWWVGREYKFTEAARKSGARSGTGYYTVEWYTHQFSVFFNKQSLKAQTRSKDVKYGDLNFAKSGTCKRLK